MSKLYSVGELLIDFQSVGTGGLSETAQFVKNAGGAPANVCVQAAKLGRQTAYLSKVGEDGFGQFLIAELERAGVDVSHISRTGEYDTSLAFVSLREDGEREFAFYRRAAADLQLEPGDFSSVRFAAGDVLEFGSVALASEKGQRAHKYLIERAKSAGAVVCFDPNLRFNLWESAKKLRRTVINFAPCADVIKLGRDELEFITGRSGYDGADDMFTGALKILLVTDGARGARLYTADGEYCRCDGFRVRAVDATGAGDSFFGGFIAELMERGFNKSDYEHMLAFACKCGAYTATGYGAIPAMGDREIIERAVQ